MKLHITEALAARHEALHLRLGTLLRQVEAIAARKPEAAVAATSRAIAEALLYDAQAFRPQGSKRGLVAVAGDFAGLSAQLGQALAALEAFESQNSEWNAALNAHVWHSQGEALPVRRLRPELVAPLRDRDRDRRKLAFRKQLAHLIDAKYSEGYDQGYEAGQNGTPAEDVSHLHADRMWPPKDKMSATS